MTVISEAEVKPNNFASLLKTLQNRPQIGKPCSKYPNCSTCAFLKYDARCFQEKWLKDFERQFVAFQKEQVKKDQAIRDLLLWLQNKEWRGVSSEVVDEFWDRLKPLLDQDLEVSH